MEIKSSIKYAKTIQSAMLSTIEKFDKRLEHFLIYRPKDIVSGDFYWFTTIKNEKLKIDKIFIIIADCTGHGVPGAFMSLIGTNLLNEIIKIHKIYETDKILDLLDEKVMKVLRQEKTENRDGMDISLCCFDMMNPKQVKLSFSSAKQSMFYFKDKTSSVERIKGTKRLIGGMYGLLKNHEFKVNNFNISPKDTVYICSDGIIDQNSPDRKRFGTPRFIRVLDRFAHLTLENQKNKINAMIDEFKQEEEQRDDITLMGIKLKN